MAEKDLKILTATINSKSDSDVAKWIKDLLICFKFIKCKVFEADVDLLMQEPEFLKAKNDIVTDEDFHKRGELDLKEQQNNKIAEFEKWILD